MLELKGSRFTRGRSDFRDYVPSAPEPIARVYVKIRLAHLSKTSLALLDTGAAWSILPPAVAEDARISVRDGDPARLSTRLGLLDGFLVKVPLTFIADEGASLDWEGTFFLSEDWPLGRIFLGYSGLLDSLRFALDPQANDFYFGPG